jgi:hypothetical protein
MMGDPTGHAYGPGACLVLAQLLRALKAKGILTEADIEGLLQPAEAALSMFGAAEEREAGDVMALIRDGSQ